MLLHSIYIYDMNVGGKVQQSFLEKAQSILFGVESALQTMHNILHPANCSLVHWHISLVFFFQSKILQSFYFYLNCASSQLNQYSESENPRAMIFSINYLVDFPVKSTCFRCEKSTKIDLCNST